jgi:hypothetical protein
MRFALVLALAACSKSEPPTAARPLDAAPAPLPPPPPPPDAAPPADAPAAQPSAPDPTTEAEIEKQAEYMANMLTADEATAVEGTMERRRPGADLGAQLAEARDAAPASASFTIAITLGDPADPADAALAKIEAAYRPGLRRCFHAAKFTGGPELSLTIAPTGRVTSTRVSYGDAIADCVEAQARNWRFAATERETLLVLQLRVPEVPR